MSREVAGVLEPHFLLLQEAAAFVSSGMGAGREHVPPLAERSLRGAYHAGCGMCTANPPDKVPALVGATTNQQAKK